MGLITKMYVYIYIYICVCMYIYIYMFIYLFFFGCVSLSGDMSCVRVDRSRPITVFCCSVRPMFSVMCGPELLFVYGCWL